MASQWTLFCPATGRRHEGWGCASCLAMNPDQEVIDLDPPHPQASTSIFPRPHNATRFPNYSRVQGAEHHRQSAIPTSSKSSASVLSATVVFYLLTQTKNDDGILILTSCKALDRISARLKLRTIESLEDFILHDLFPGMCQNDFIRLPTDELRLATSICQSAQVPTTNVVIVREIVQYETTLSRHQG